MEGKDAGKAPWNKATAAGKKGSFGRSIGEDRSVSWLQARHFAEVRPGENPFECFPKDKKGMTGESIC